MLGWRGSLICVFLCQFWTQTPVIAGKGCSGFGHLENGRVFFRYGGLYVTFTCNPGYRIHGYRTSSCVSGQWARDPPLCVASGCPSLGDLLHGSTLVSKDRSLATFSCDTGYSLFGSAFLFCKGKSWNGTKPVCKVADIMSVLYLNQDSLHSPVSAQGRDVPTSLKVYLHSHLNTAHKDAFLKTVLRGAPYIRLDFTDHKQKNVLKPVEKKPSKILLSDKTRDGGKAEPIHNLENFKGPIRNSDLQKSETVASANVNTISLTSSFLESPLWSTTPTSFVTPTMHTQQVMDQTFTQAPYRRYQSTLSADKLFQTASVISAAKTLPEYSKNNSNWMLTTPAANINTLDTDDRLQSETLIKVDTADSFEPSATIYPSFMMSKHESVSSALDQWSTSPSTSSRLFEQRPDLTETSLSPDTTGTTISPGQEVLMTATQLVPSDLHLKAPTDVQISTDITEDQVNEKSNQSDPKQTLDMSAWKDLARFSRIRRPVCPYPPFPSHGTFYFRSIKNPDPLQYKHYIQYACYPGYTLTNGDVYSYCQHNGQWSGQTPLCLELTPCSINNGGCSQICHVNSQDRAQCLCKPGFLLLEDQRTCRDLDECVEELHLCQQVCQNTLGSYRCSCSPGFQISSDGTSCSDVDECERVGTALCVFGCINTPGSFQCLCPIGYQLDSNNRDCKDINECDDPAVLQQKQMRRCEWKCVNLPGTYRCVCPRGYRLHPNGHQCEDVNECELKNGNCSHLCINHRGGYKCACPETHQIYPNNQKNCQPVDKHTISSH
ncbi:sushi, von Willebrand factor type A, EGF and pentraxin domain-containing protein 1 [Puntigrus tetrazona]|uniref:sushi, von Willebrand factor type A, EGF and pentraxin domain-containing protein 1 n=1 Tax=Puntigrus tetrazona TaxID=1606681 RepID=UPI001C8968DB|nr:sushi, von Willebrand factor type A, EGF and pentraxin domain-containing protein 1 [Puntigrus tetrazona]